MRTSPHIHSQFTAALLKVASRCNLNCDYCYVYNHIDQSWKSQPKLMSEATITAFAQKLKSYLDNHNLKEFSIIFHGGEPLLYTPQKLSNAVKTITSIVPSDIQLDFSIQTNGVLLDNTALEILVNANISISLSLDGNKQANDLHRLDHQGRSSFDSTLHALERLRQLDTPHFSGVISVIDPTISPSELFNFFYPLNIPRLDLLLPDATHATLPPGRRHDQKLYTRWLRETFTLWYQQYNDMPIRFFDAILGTRLGIPSPTDALGFGQVSLIVIETDGTYTDHDVFKITKPNANRLHGSVFDTEFVSLLKDNSIIEHNFRLTYDGVAQECKTCPIVEACGGGSIMHRYHPERGLDAPTTYCSEMFYLVEHATQTLCEELSSMSKNEQNNAELVDGTLQFSSEFTHKCAQWRAKYPDFIVQNNKGNQVPANLWLGKVRIPTDAKTLVEPFADSIQTVSPTSDKFTYGLQALDKAAQLLYVYSSDLVDAMCELVSDIVFVESTLDYETGIFSFSDDSMPNVIYLDPYVGSQPLLPDDIADSILHEFLHHVLYHLEMEAPLLYNYDVPRFPAPWRQGLRPAGGFLHGTFVFSGLTLFWRSLANGQETHELIDKSKAKSNSSKFLAQAMYGVRSTKKFALLTPAGKVFVERLAQQLGQNIDALLPPGSFNIV